MGAGGALPDWGAVGEGDGWGGRAMAGVGEGWALVGAGDGTTDQAGAGAGEGGVARALGPEREAGLRASEAWVEPPSVGAGVMRPGPGWGRLSVSDKGRGVGGWMALAVAEAGAGLVGVEADSGYWMQGVGGPCSSPGSSPDCALGLRP